MTNLRSGVAYHPESRQTHRPRPIGQYLHVESIVNKPQSKRFCCIMKNIGVVAAIWCWWTTPSVILAYTLSASRVEGNAPAVGLDRTNPRQHLRTTKSFSVGNQNSRRKTTQYALDLHRMAIEGDRRNPTNDQESAPPGARLMADANEPVNDDDDDKEKKSSGTAEGGDNDDEPILNITDQREKFETETNALETVESLEQETSEERAAPEGEESSPEDQNERVSELVLGQPANQDQRDPEPSTEGDDGDDDTANDDGTADDNGNDDVNDDGTANDDVNDDGTANDDGNKNDDVGANSGDRVHMDNEPVDGGKTRESNNLIDPTMDDDVSSQTERQSVDRKIRQVGILSVLIGVLAMIFTAWQMSDNPDGMYAAMCRLVITIMGLVLGLILRPCRICLGGPGSNRHQQGHIPVSTMDYGYRDPSLEMS